MSVKTRLTLEVRSDSVLNGLWSVASTVTDKGDSYQITNISGRGRHEEEVAVISQLTLGRAFPARNANLSIFHDELIIISSFPSYFPLSRCSLCFFLVTFLLAGQLRK